MINRILALSVILMLTTASSLADSASSPQQVQISCMHGLRGCWNAMELSRKAKTQTVQVSTGLVLNAAAVNELLIALREAQSHLTGNPHEKVRVHVSPANLMQLYISTSYELGMQSQR